MWGEEGIVVELALVAALILLNGFFAGAEIAVISARRGRLEAAARSGDRRAATVLRLKDDPDRFLATVQIGVTMVGTLASAVAGVAAVEELEPLFASIPLPWLAAAAEPLAVGIVVFSIGYLTLVVGELVPKTVAVRNAETLALLVARPVDWLSRISRPAVAALTASSAAVLRLFGQRADSGNPFLSLDDLRAIVRDAEAQGLVADNLVRGAVEFQDRVVRDVLTPPNQIHAIPVDATLERALKIAAQSRHSRLPVYQGSLDNVIGVVLVRELYEAQGLGQPQDLRALLRPVAIVPVTKRATALLAEMRRSGCQMALAVDEHGATRGLVTFQDLVDVIVGKSRAEHQREPGPVRVLQQGGLEVDGSVTVRDINQTRALGLPESEDYVTLAGLILARLGALAKEGSHVDVDANRLTVLALEGRRIARVRIEGLAPELAAAAAATEQARETA